MEASFRAAFSIRLHLSKLNNNAVCAGGGGVVALHVAAAKIEF